LKFLENVVTHLMTRHTKRFGVGEFQRRVEAAPEDDAGNKSREHQCAKTEDRARAAQNAPNFQDKVERAPPERRTRSIDHRHRCAPDVFRVSSVSMSTKSFTTGGFTLCCGTWHSVQK